MASANGSGSCRPLKKWYIILPLHFMGQWRQQASLIQGEGKYTHEGKNYLESFGIRERKASKGEIINGITVSIAENILEHEPSESLAQDYKARQTSERLSNECLGFLIWSASKVLWTSWNYMQNAANKRVFLFLKEGGNLYIQHPRHQHPWRLWSKKYK